MENDYEYGYFVWLGHALSSGSYMRMQMRNHSEIGLGGLISVINEF